MFARKIGRLQKGKKQIRIVSASHFKNEKQILELLLVYCLISSRLWQFYNIAEVSNQVGAGTNL